ncbi:metal-sensing transcriptional repressor [Aminicella lysinilytica]|uniref:DNA-binding FrmR family transcriptional regulator n=1 Tax=Aminicella lysinilytica TaxID=433323 RepID=A0A4R6QCV5_9FIRM|nr:metal-sensing transcriptional repressor [Aminicella lysinilytica]NLD10842.1 metal-sensing transcriptional repressor [Clostridiales bacterium]TDP59786.1 DNA-binding FrmR family transcriptional regulator [Aminicella lysinilytica]
MDKNTCPACTGKTKHREGKEYDDLIKRLNRIEGQIRGIRKMVEADKYCVDIMTQASAAESAMKAFNTALLKQHIRSCVVEDIKEGNDEAVAELCELLPKMMK